MDKQLSITKEIGRLEHNKPTSSNRRLQDILPSKEYTFNSSTRAIFTRINHILDHKTSLIN